MESSGKRNWIYAIIAFLLLALVVETGYLISQARMKPRGAKERRLTAEHFPASNPKTAPPQTLVSSYNAPYSGTQWDPFFEELRRMQEEMSRSINEGVGRMMRSPTFQAPVASFFNADQFPSYSPAIDLQEMENAYIAKADLPGLEKEKIQVSVSGNVLTISGERKEETQKEDAQQGVHTTERTYGTFSRSISLPGPVDEAGIAADYKNGVLTVTLPKLKGAALAPKQVPIS